MDFEYEDVCPCCQMKDAVVDALIRLTRKTGEQHAEAVVFYAVAENDPECDISLELFRVAVIGLELEENLIVVDAESRQIRLN